MLDMHLLQQMLFLKERKGLIMRVLLSDRLRSHLQQIGSTVLTVTLNPLRC